MFDKATRLKLRFDSPRGLLTTEDLWDLPLTGKVSLDGLAIGLARQLRDSDAAVSFVVPAEAASTELQLRFDVVKHVLDVKVKERDEAKTANDRASKKQQLLEILARKENAELEGKSAEELKNMINSL